MDSERSQTGNVPSTSTGMTRPGGRAVGHSADVSVRLLHQPRVPDQAGAWRTTTRPLGILLTVLLALALLLVTGPRAQATTAASPAGTSAAGTLPAGDAGAAQATTASASDESAGRVTTASIDPDATTAIEVHKLDQPEQLGEPASGVEQDVSGLTPVAGATFTATRVPGLDLTTDAGRAEASTLTAADAIARIGDAAPDVTRTTDASGLASLAPLGVGLYLVDETVTPDGYASSDPFLVALPLTTPAGDGWLETVHVYPKNAGASADLAVDDTDAVVLGDTVRWTSRTTVPRAEPLRVYRVLNRVADGLEPPTADQVAVTLGDGTALGADDVTIAVDGTLITVAFTDAGRTRLADLRATNPDLEVHVAYPTVVTAEGEHTNRVRLVITDDGVADADQTSRLTDTATTKWGPLEIIVTEQGRPDHRIPGTRLRLYLSAEDALAGRDPVTIEGVSEWTTDTDGRVLLHGLRFSGFVDGLDRDTDDPLYRQYWVMPVSFPAGWTGDLTPQAAIVNSVTDAQIVTLQVRQADEGTAGLLGPGGALGPGTLARTGLQASGAVLLAAVLVLLGLAARRRGRATAEVTAGAAGASGANPDGSAGPATNPGAR